MYSYPDATDSAEGITTWWLTSTGYTENCTVQAVLMHLNAQGFIHPLNELTTDTSARRTSHAHSHKYTCAAITTEIALTVISDDWYPLPG